MQFYYDSNNKRKFFCIEYLASGEHISYRKIALIFGFYRGVVSCEAKFGVIIIIMVELTRRQVYETIPSCIHDFFFCTSCIHDFILNEMISLLA